MVITMCKTFNLHPKVYEHNCVALICDQVFNFRVKNSTTSSQVECNFSLCMNERNAYAKMEYRSIQLATKFMIKMDIIFRNLYGSAQLISAL